MLLDTFITMEIDKSILQIQNAIAKRQIIGKSKRSKNLVELHNEFKVLQGTYFEVVKILKIGITFLAITGSSERLFSVQSLVFNIFQNLSGKWSAELLASDGLGEQTC